MIEDMQWFPFQIIMVHTADNKNHPTERFNHY